MKTPADSKAYETTDAQVRPLVVFGASLVVMTLAVLVLSRVMVADLNSRADRSDAAEAPLAWPTEPPPGPHLQADPQAEMRAFRAAQEARLSRYDWVDRDAGIVQVPLERALELVVERGLPARQPPREEAR